MPCAPGSLRQKIEVLARDSPEVILLSELKLAYPCMSSDQPSVSLFLLPPATCMVVIIDPEIYAILQFLEFHLLVNCGGDLFLLLHLITFSLIAGLQES